MTNRGQHRKASITFAGWTCCSTHFCCLFSTYPKLPKIVVTEAIIPNKAEDKGKKMQIWKPQISKWSPYFNTFQDYQPDKMPNKDWCIWCQGAMKKRFVGWACKLWDITVPTTPAQSDRGVLSQDVTSSVEQPTFLNESKNPKLLVKSATHGALHCPAWNLHKFTILAKEV